MFATGRGFPPWSLVMIVAFAGYLRAGRLAQGDLPRAVEEGEAFSQGCLLYP